MSDTWTIPLLKFKWYEICFFSTLLARRKVGADYSICLACEAVQLSCHATAPSEGSILAKAAQRGVRNLF